MQHKIINFIGVPLSLGTTNKDVDKLPHLLRSIWLPLNPSINDLGDIPCPKFDSDKRSQEETQAKNLTQILKVSEQLEKEVYRVIKKKELPIVIGGDHSVTIGTAMGIKKAVGKENLIVIYLSSHAALHNEETSHTGDVHGMQLAILLGEGKSNEVEKYVGKEAVINYENLHIFGCREIDEEEKSLAKRLDIKMATQASHIEKDIVGILSQIKDNKNKHILLSIDIDVINTPATRNSDKNGGIKIEVLQNIIRQIKKTDIPITYEIVEVLTSKDQGNRTKKEIIQTMNEIIAKQ